MEASAAYDKRSDKIQQIILRVAEKDSSETKKKNVLVEVRFTDICADSFYCQLFARNQNRCV